MLRSAKASAALAVVGASLGLSAMSADAKGLNTSPSNTITVAVDAPLVNWASVFLAKGDGLFKKYGVNVNILESTGAETLPDIVSGQADITIFSVTSALVLASQGKPVSEIYNFSRDPGSDLIGAKGVTSIAQLQALGSKCVIGSQVTGSQGYGYAKVFIHSHLGLQNCTISPASSTAVTIAQLESGQISAASATPTIYNDVKQAYPASLLVNANDPNFRKEFGVPNFLTGTFFGLQSDLNAKRKAVVKFLQAIDAATALLTPKNVDFVAKKLEPFASFSPVPLAVNELSLKQTINSIGQQTTLATPQQVKQHPKADTSQPGWITPTDWALAINQYGNWDIPGISLTATYASYPKAVDMSYLKAALAAGPKG
jgi:ABC-type nitrate/sulfonate/bicarbonate transport system substrate-binding protein